MSSIIPPPIPASRPTTTLSSLPRELLVLVSSSLDQTSLVELSRVSRATTFLADERLWRTLYLRLPDHYGEQPLVQPYPDLCTEDSDRGKSYQEWEAQEERAAEERIRDALRERTNQIIISADKRKLSLVRSIVFNPRPGAVRAALTLLDLASAHLESLEVIGPVDVWQYKRDCPLSYETLDFNLPRSHLRFPALTHVRIGPDTTCSGGIYVSICALAPNLHTLDIECQRIRIGDRCTQTPLSPIRPKRTRIRRLRMNWHLDDVPDGQLQEAFILIVGSSPDLRQLSVSCDDSAIRDVIQAIGRLEKLEDLHWTCPHTFWEEVQDLGGEGFTGLKRLVLCTWNDLEIFRNLPTIPGLEKIYYDPRYTLNPRPAGSRRSVDHETDVQPMNDQFADMLVHTPALQLIIPLASRDYDRGLGVFDEIDTINPAGESSGVISSYHHGDEVLLHACLLMSYVEVLDARCPIENVSSSSVGELVHYRTRDGGERVKVYYRQKEDVWQDFVHYEGEWIPLHTLEEMRMVEVLSEREWNRRGVIVGDKAWKILRDCWKDYWGEEEDEETDSSESD